MEPGQEYDANQRESLLPLPSETFDAPLSQDVGGWVQSTPPPTVATTESELPQRVPTGETHSSMDVETLDAHTAELHTYLHENAISSGYKPCADDVFHFFESLHASSIMHVDDTALFHWVQTFLSIHESLHPDERNSLMEKYDAKRQLEAIRHLQMSDDYPSTAQLFQLQSVKTLQYWNYRFNDSLKDSQRSKKEEKMTIEKELEDWIRANEHTNLMKMNVLAHIKQKYPQFAAAKTPAALKTWVIRFLKRKIVVQASKPESKKRSRSENASDATVLECPKDTRMDGKKQKTEKAGYVPHSNAFKLNALRMLDEGNTPQEVQQELGIKNASTLVYWSSIRDKLAMSEMNKLRLAGGGRKTSCGFEDELLEWIGSKRRAGESKLIMQNRMIRTLRMEVDASVSEVMAYIKDHHAGFAEGKKEASLRRWVLRFFKRKFVNTCEWKEDGEANDMPVFI